MKFNRIALLIIIGLMLIVSLFIYRSYSLWTITNTQTSTNDIGVGCFSISVTDQDNINLTNTFPISDAKGLTLKPYQFTIKNTCTINAKYQINLETLSTTTLDSQFVKISLDGQTPQLLNSFSSGTKNISDSISSYLLDEDYLVAGESRTYNISLWLTDTATKTDAENKVLNAKITSNFVATKADYLSNRLISDAGGKSTIEAKTIKNYFSTITTDEGMYATPDDYGTSYYYRGATTTNNLIFGGFCWKVIRINGNGSVRVIYNGLPNNGVCDATGTNTSIGSTNYNALYTDNAYVGYMYGTINSSNYNDTHANVNDSDIKKEIDTWYENNLINHSAKISDTLFCNDRSITSESWTSDATETGYGTNTTTYATYHRIYDSDSKAPSLLCSQKNDRFTVKDNSIGNASLKYPIALITGDEVYFAGTSYNHGNTQYYLYTGNDSWTMSPSLFTSGNAKITNITSSGSILTLPTRSSSMTQPVINLVSNIIYTSGSGTTADPFIIAE